MNSVNEGITSQNIPLDRLITFETSLVSIYNHIMAKTDINGIDANIDAKKELCLDISETSKIIIDVKINLKTR
tara:strand:- start:516 stop:734 length:219 start_codon:yes stop_codon:yes gene_type:complete